MYKENTQTKRRLHSEMKRNTHLKGIYTEKKPYKKGEGIYKQKEGITRNGESGVIS